MVVLFELLLVEGQLQYGLLGELSLAALTDHCCTCTPIPASTLAPTLAAALREGFQVQMLPKFRHCLNGGGSDPCLDFCEGFVHMH